MRKRAKKFLGVLFLVVLPLLAASESRAQVVNDKKFEFSTAASMWTVKWEWADESTTITNLPFRFGYFVYKGLEIEPEVILTIPEESDETGFSVAGNLSYNVKAGDFVIPFILAGFGYGNAFPSLSMAFDADETVTSLNFGAGIKVLVGDSGALRLEYRFARYSFENGEHCTQNNILLGVSLFF